MPSAIELDLISRLLIWTAIAIYALAFVVYAMDLSKRAQMAVDRKDALAGERAAAPKVLVAAGGVESGTPRVLNAARTRVDEGAPLVEMPVRNVLARVGTALMWLAFIFHVVGTVLRGLAVGHVPWSNMYEFAMTGTVLMAAVYLGTLFRYDLRYLGSFISGLLVVFLGGATLLGQASAIVPLPDPLKSAWLVIHVFVATLSTAFFALACGLSILQLLQLRRETKRIAAREAGLGKSFLDTIPPADKLEGLAYRFSIIGFILWTFTLMAGSIWANDAWGRYWGFDTKEVWTFVIWVLYAGYIHARATRGWRGAPSAWLSIVGFACVIFNFTIVNMFFKGLHAYSGLE